VTGSKISNLPIDSMKESLQAALNDGNQLLIKAEPGAGKTTRVPLFAYETLHGCILVLEPRRVAAKMSAEYVAELLGEPVGKTVGYRMRFESRVSPQSRIIFITEGLFLKILSTNPILEGVSAVIIDEFHERSLNTDLTLAMVTHLQGNSRKDLKLIVMSATIDFTSLEEWLPAARTFEVKGRAYPVSISYQYPFPGETLDKQIIRASLQNTQGGDILVFLSNTAEIFQIQRRLERFWSHLQVIPLNSEMAAQSMPMILADGKRKLILSTNLAETSLTIPGITLVIDSGWHLQSRVAPWSGLHTLEKKRVSKDSAIQRSGRAGRVQAGHCVRLYDEHDFQMRAEFRTPEIKRVDLAQTILELLSLDLLTVQTNGIEAKFRWYERPDDLAWVQAIETLKMLNVIDENGLTELGHEVASFNLHPRLGAMLQKGKQLGCYAVSAMMAAYISEGGIDTLDLFRDVQFLMNEALSKRGTHDRLQKTYRKLLLLGESGNAANDSQAAQILLAGFADRVGKLLPKGVRHKSDGRWQGEYAFSGGRSGVAEFESQPGEFLVVLDASEVSIDQIRRTKIRIASPLMIADLASQGLYRVQLFEEWSDNEGCMISKEKVFYGQLLLDEKKLEVQGNQRPNLGRIFVEVKKIWPKCFSDQNVIETYHHVISLLDRKKIVHEFPKIEGDFLDLLINFLVEEYQDFKKITDLKISSILEEHLGWSLWNQFKSEFPSKIRIPSGRDIEIHYELDRDPWIEARIQEFFSSQETPWISSHKIKLAVHLLSPAGRPLQVTSDLDGFWKGSYKEVQKQMKTRYPKHPWPDDPLAHPPVLKSKGR